MSVCCWRRRTLLALPRASPLCIPSASVRQFLPSPFSPPPVVFDEDDVIPSRPDYGEVFMPLLADNSFSRRFAFALIDPPAVSPGYILRRALEGCGGNPSFALSASHYGALMVVFPSMGVREETIPFFPVEVDGYVVSLERPEHADNRFSFSFEWYAQVSATGFPLEYWNEGGIRQAFRSIGSDCRIDPLCLNELDFSSVRLVLKLEHDMDVPLTLLIRDFQGSSSTVVDLHVVRVWSCDDEFAATPHFHNHECGSRCQCRLSDIDSDPSPSWRAQGSSVRPDIGSGAGFRERLAKYLAGLHVASVATRAREISPPPQVCDDGAVFSELLTTPSPHPVLLLQWYDAPATPIGEPFIQQPVDDAVVPAPVMTFSASQAMDLGEPKYEGSARKRRVRGKRVSDNAHKARRHSERIAARQIPTYVNVMTKAKKVKAVRLDVSKGSTRIRSSIRAVIAEDGAIPPALPLTVLKELASPCDIDTADVEATRVSGSAP
ncbi:unnamed protein product [Alopecurus aequalis]